MKFKDILKELREERGLTQKNVAIACQVSPTCINQLEAGTRNPTGSTLMALANYFNCSIDYLMGRENTLEDSIFYKAPHSQLSESEQKLLENFRSLPLDLKHRAESYLQNLSDAARQERFTINQKS